MDRIIGKKSKLSKQEHNSQRKEIVVLPSWYPNKLDKFGGDFIQRHVKAIASVRRQFVIYVVKDEFAAITNDVSVNINEAGLYTEKIIYYHVRKTGMIAIDKILSQVKSNRLYHEALKKYIEANGIPQLIHVHVSLKAGLVALWAKNKWSIPFIISEHWSVFLPEANYKVKDLPMFQQWAIKKILKSASGLSVVSAQLGRAIADKYTSPSHVVIPNVVDHAIFLPGYDIKDTGAHFIHASSMLYEKNIEGILTAFHILNEKKIDCSLSIYGPAPARIKQLSKELGLGDVVVFGGEVSQGILSEKMQESAALVLYSRFETFGCVIIEANATGIPVIVSDLPVFHETVEEGVNGFFVQGERPDLLAEKISQFVAQKSKLDKASIIKTSEKYSYKAVAAKFEKLYAEAIGNQ